jgi:hypothetical protein
MKAVVIPQDAITSLLKPWTLIGRRLLSFPQSFVSDRANATLMPRSQSHYKLRIFPCLSAPINSTSVRVQHCPACTTAGQTVLCSAASPVRNSRQYKYIISRRHADWPQPAAALSRNCYTRRPANKEHKTPAVSCGKGSVAQQCWVTSPDGQLLMCVMGHFHPLTSLTLAT